MTLNEKLSVIQTELHAKKSKWNGFGKYNYRSAEDILEALKPHLKKHKVTVMINESLEEINGMTVMHSSAIISDGSDKIETVATVGVDMDQRGMNLPQKFGSASSYAKKYALGNLFLIDDTADPDATNTHGKDSKPKPKLEGEALNKAKDFIKKGGKLETIKKKYEVSAEVLKQLNNL